MDELKIYEENFLKYIMISFILGNTIFNHFIDFLEKENNELFEQFNYNYEKLNCIIKGENIKLLNSLFNNEFYFDIYFDPLRNFKNDELVKSGYEIKDEFYYSIPERFFTGEIVYFVLKIRIKI